MAYLIYELERNGYIEGSAKLIPRKRSRASDVHNVITHG